MANHQSGERLLIYSHDCYGLGHLRRCRAIAHALAERRPNLSILIISGSPLAGSFEFHPRVDFIRIPGVLKRRNDGVLEPMNLNLALEDVMEMRAGLIRRTAELFGPDIFLVDHVPMGLRNEARDTLTMLKAKGTRLVLGYRDIHHIPKSAMAWERDDFTKPLSTFYDHVLVYGLESFHDPFAKMGLSKLVKQKISFTGYLRTQDNSSHAPTSVTSLFGDRPYILAVTGGGGDGDGVVDWILRAYESDTTINYPALVVLGPLMHPELRNRFMERVNQLDQVHAITFKANIESLIAHSAGVVSMCGYNAFCEILSFDKPGLIVPRTHPGKEQYIRAVRAEELGLTRMLLDESARDGHIMADALNQLPLQDKPSSTSIPGLLDGLDELGDMVDEWYSAPYIKPAELSIVSKKQ